MKHMNQEQSWFEVDKVGLSKLLDRQGKHFAIFELVQNAWDENSNNVKVTIEDNVLRGYSLLIVEDDNPNGFADLSHAYTLFAESGKKNKTNKRGRFNLGEKLVLALCKEARIETVGREVQFLETGERTIGTSERSSGSEFRAVIKMSKKEREECIKAFHRLIPPPGIITTINGEELRQRESAQDFKASLPTIAADDEGRLFETTRKTQVHLYEPKGDEKPTLYEMGIPVVDLEGRFHIDVQQKVPVNMDRDNVKPSYIKRLRMEVVNNAHHLLSESDSHETWVKEATEHPGISKESLGVYLDLSQGKERVIFDLSDLEANKMATAAGMTVIAGRSLTSNQWENVKKHDDLVLPAGQVTPSPKAYAGKSGEDGFKPVPMDNWTDGMTNIADFSKRLAVKLLGREIKVVFYNESQTDTIASYGPSGILTYNIGRLGYKWFDEPTLEKVVDLAIHEFGHEYELDHFSRDYYDALTRLAGQCTKLALDEPSFFDCLSMATAAEGGEACQS